MTKPNQGDHRVKVALGLLVAGGIIVGGAALLHGDSLQEFLVIAAYSIGWVLLTFGALYWLNGKLDNMLWDRPDHDLVAIFEAGKRDEDDPPSTQTHFIP